MIDLDNDAHAGEGNFAAIDGQGTIGCEHIIHGNLDDRDSHLGDKAGDAQLADRGDHRALELEITLFQIDAFEPLEIEKRDDAGENLPQNGGDSGAVYAHIHGEHEGVV